MKELEIEETDREISKFLLGYYHPVTRHLVTLVLKSINKLVLSSWEKGEKRRMESCKRTRRGCSYLKGRCAKIQKEEKVD